MTYASDVPGAVEVDANGVMTLRANHEALVGVSAQTSCAPVASDSVQLAANLQAAFRGVDLGSNDGLQFEEVADSVSAPLLVNAGGHRLTSFQIIVEFDDALLLASGYAEGVAGGSLASAFFSGPSVTFNEPTDEVLLLGNKDGSVAPTGLVQLATLALDVQIGRAHV